VPVYYKNASGIRELNGDFESTSNSSTLENSVETTTDTLSVYWVDILNMSEIRTYIDELDLVSQNLRAVVVDHNGTTIIDTLPNKISQGTKIDILKGNSSSQTNLLELQNVKLGLNVETGSIVEYMNGTSTTTSFHPMVVFTRTWATILVDLDSYKL
jgi:hypothetical protein